MGWIAVDEPFAAPPKFSAPTATEPLGGPVHTDDGFVQLTDVAIAGDLSMSGCDELEIVDSTVTGGAIFCDGEFSIETRRSVFDNCDLSQLRFTSIRGSRIVGSKLVGTDFAGGRLEDTIFERCTFRYSNLRDVSLDRVSFVDCTLDDVDFFEAKLDNVDFDGSSLTKINVDRLKASRVDLRGARELGLDAIGSLKGCLVDEQQVHQLLFGLAFAAGLGVEQRDH